MATIPSPQVEELLPPLLAHIPIAFSSKTAPPSLLPLLAPILRSRVTLLTNNNNNDSEPSSSGLSSLSDSWLALLTWSTNGAELCQSLAEQDFSPHPSGEFEIGEYEFKGIRRVDAETLKARVELIERGVEVFYVWVDAKEDKDEGNEWKVMDVRLVDEESCPGESWYPTVAAAEEGFREEGTQKKQQQHQNQVNHYATKSPPPSFPSIEQKTDGEGEDDSSYWDMYDRSPVRTPAVHHQTQLPNEDEYFAQYSTVSPVLDSVELPPTTEALTAHTYPTYPTATTQPQPPLAPFTIPMSPPHSLPSKSTSLAVSPTLPPAPSTTEIQTPSPRATSPNSHSGPAVLALENSAAVQLQAEVVVKQHISTTIKSLFRLAKASGIAREEFDRIVNTELEVLSMVEEEEEGRVSW